MAINAAQVAGEECHKHYQQSLVVNYKGDGFPLTVADQAAHRVITDCLARSQIIIVSEEDDNLHLEAERCWLVDPLDGTRISWRATENSQSTLL